ncbi:MAG: site-2 protease family protein [Myxococcaceae bacterium]
MRGSIRIGSVRGVQLRIHFSFLLILPVLAFLFGQVFANAARAAQVPPEELVGSPLLWGLGIAVALFLAVLVHELAHTLYGQARGAKVRDITLLMIGGVSTMTEAPKKPGDEAIMAFVGPLASLVIAGIFFGIYQLLGEASFNLRFAVFYLAQMNLILGLFNLLPAFPMDGGRVLRALLAGRLGMVRGTQIAATLGKGFAALLGIFGVLSFNIILMFIAYFVYVGAEGEARQVGLRAAIGHLPVRSMMRPLTASVYTSDPVAVAAEKMLSERRLGLPVIDGVGAVGMVTLEQVVRVPPEERFARRVSEIVVPAKSLSPNDEVWDAMQALQASNLPQLPVVEDGRLVGTLRLEDVMRGLRLHQLLTPPRSSEWRWPGGRREVRA